METDTVANGQFSAKKIGDFLGAHPNPFEDLKTETGQVDTSAESSLSSAESYTGLSSVRPSKRQTLESSVHVQTLVSMDGIDRLGRRRPEGLDPLDGIDRLGRRRPEGLKKRNLLSERATRGGRKKVGTCYSRWPSFSAAHVRGGGGGVGEPGGLGGRTLAREVLGRGCVAVGEAVAVERLAEGKYRVGTS